MAAKWQRIKIPIRKKFKPKERVVIAQEIIDHIVKRTRDGKDKRGNAWSGAAGRYSKAYKESLDFKIAGKSKSKVNLTLSREMLNSLKLLRHSKGELVIGFDRGSDANAKADGNIRGTYGQKTPIRGKARDFLGVEQKVKKEIQDNYDSKVTDRATILERINRISEILDEDGEN